MANPWKSKKPLEDNATYKAADSPSTENDAVDKVAKTTDKNLTSKRRKLDTSGTSSGHPQAIEVVVSNEDLLTEILSLVPLRSLLKFKSVSKHWHSLISDSKFASYHACRSRTCRPSLISGLYSYHKHSKLQSLPLHGHLSPPTLAFLDPVREPSESRVVASCNGLMLFSNGSRMHYIVCNPTTQKYIALPELDGSTSPKFCEQFGAYLAFDPSISPYYKVVLIGYHHGDKERSGSYLIHIYSSKTGSWKEMHAEAPRGGSSQLRVFWNAAIHWMNPANFHIRLEVDAENLTGTPLPKVPYILAERKTRFFGKCGDSLLLIQTREYITLRFRILEMKKDCFCWIVKYRVNLRPVISEFRYLPSFSVLCCANGPDKKDLVLVLRMGGKVIAYNLNLKSVKVLLDLYCSCYHSYDNTYQFIRSFSPV